MVCGYDIACRCQGSLTSHWEGFESDRISSLPEDAGEEEKKRRPLNILLTCGVWHGYAHNRACQVSHLLCIIVIVLLNPLLSTLAAVSPSSQCCWDRRSRFGRFRSS